MTHFMFETKPPQAPVLPPSELAGDDLRALSWSDLVAKLDAARDLRNCLQEAKELRGASFAPDVSRCLAAHHEAGHGNYEDYVNLEDSANRKAACGNGEGLDGADKPMGEPREE